MLCSPITAGHVAQEKQLLLLRICLNSDINLNLALKDMHSRSVKGTKGIGYFSFFCDNNQAGKVLYRMKTALWLMVPEAYESSKAGGQSRKSPSSAAGAGA